jgi:hypothetical protein
MRISMSTASRYKGIEARGWALSCSQDGRGRVHLQSLVRVTEAVAGWRRGADVEAIHEIAVAIADLSARLRLDRGACTVDEFAAAALGHIEQFSPKHVAAFTRPHVRQLLGNAMAQPQAFAWATTPLALSTAQGGG